jgi:hypothetical protein
VGILIFLRFRVLEQHPISRNRNTQFPDRIEFFDIDKVEHR